MTRRGFSLVELAVVLAISGLMVSFWLQARQSTMTGGTGNDCYAATRSQLTTIRDSIERFARKNDRLPMPAARNIGTESINFGRESSGANIDQNAGVSFGALPFQALGLTDSYAFDCWGNKLTYVVTTALTTNAGVGGFLDNAVVGNITLKSSTVNTINSTTAYAIISHGEDGLGAVKTNYSAANGANTPPYVGHGWCSGAATLKTQNCLATSANVIDAVFNNGKNAGAAYYDDIVVTGGKPPVASTTTPNLYCWGTDKSGWGVLADGSVVANHHKYTPTLASGGLQFTSLAIPPLGTQGISPCGLTGDGTAYCWGYNSEYQVGDGTNVNRSVPTLVNTATKFKKLISLGNDNTTKNHCGIALDDTAWCWGDGGTSDNYIPGVLGWVSIPSPVQISNSITFSNIVLAGLENNMCGLALNGGVYCWGGETQNFATGPNAYNETTNHATPTLVSGVRKFSTLVSGIRATSLCGLTSVADPGGAGYVYCWGYGTFFGSDVPYGGLGLTPLTITNVTRANPGVVTYTVPASGLTLGAGDAIVFRDIVGMSQLNLQMTVTNFTVAAGHFTTGAGPGSSATFELNTAVDGTFAGVDTTTYTAYASGGQAIIAARNQPTKIDGAGNGTYTKLLSNMAAIDNAGILHTWGPNIDGTLGYTPGGIFNTYTVTAVTAANPAVLTTGTNNHGYVVGDWVFACTNMAQLTAQNGGSATTIKLKATSSAVDNYYTGMVVSIMSGNGAGQRRTITNYVGATKVATVAAWSSGTPNNTSKYTLGEPICGQYIVNSVPTSKTLSLKNLDGTVIDTSKTTVQNTGFNISKMPSDGSCFMYNGTGGYCSYTPQALTQSYAATPYTISDAYVDTGRAWAKTSSGFFSWGEAVFNLASGDNVSVDRYTPVPVTSGGVNLTGATTTAELDVCALSDSNALYCYGLNPYGQIGDGTTTDAQVPTLVSGGYHFSQVIPIAGVNYEVTGFCGLKQ